MNFKTALMMFCAASGISGAAFAEPAGTNVWEHTLSLGVTATSGNTDTKLFTGSWLSEYRSHLGDLTRLSVDGQYGEENGAKNSDNVKGDQNYKHLLSERSYVVGDVAELYDSIADISYRVTPSLGIGYFLIKDDAASLSVDVGPGYQWEKIGGVKDDYAIFKASERYERKLGASSKCWQSADYSPKIEDFNVYSVNGEIGAEAPLTSTINLRIVFSDRYVNVPAADHKRNDTQIVGAVAFKI